MTQKRDSIRAPLMGMNLEIKRAGRPFHIQTEDLGLLRGELVTQLFVAGSIVETFKFKYHHAQAIPPKSPPSEGQLRHQMRDQHLALVRAVQAGQYDHLLKAVHSAQPTSVITTHAPTVSHSTPLSDVAPPEITTDPPVHRSMPLSKQSLSVDLNSEAIFHQKDGYTRDLMTTQRGTHLLGQSELVAELLFLPQKSYPSFSTELTELQTCIQSILLRSQTELAEKKR